MPDYLGADQRKTKEEEKEDKPIRGEGPRTARTVSEQRPEREWGGAAGGHVGARSGGAGGAAGGKGLKRIKNVSNVQFGAAAAASGASPILTRSPGPGGAAAGWREAEPAGPHADPAVRAELGRGSRRAGGEG